MKTRETKAAATATDVQTNMGTAAAATAADVQTNPRTGAAATAADAQTNPRTAVQKSGDHSAETEAAASTTTAPCVLSWSTPAIDIYETDDTYICLADLPGVKQDALDVTFVDGKLHLNARRQLDDHSVHEYRRSLRVGHAVRATGIHAALGHGLLTVHLPKSLEAREHKIPITSI